MNEILSNVMGHMTHGIYLLTCRAGEIINGMIASWVTQISYDPPLVAVAIHPHRYSHDLVVRSGHFALHILAREQTALLARFKGPDPAAKFASLPWQAGVTGCPVLADCIGAVECRVTQTLAPGNHTLFIAQVVQAHFNGPRQPFCTLDYAGRYLGKH